MPEQPPYPPTPQEVQEISSPEQFAALAHPLRQRLLFALGRRPATISQLAAHLETAKGNVAHHLKVLRTAGLVHVAETRQVRGGTEQYYQRVARRMIVAEPEAAGTAAMFGAVAQELDRSPAETHLTLRHLHLSPAKAQHLGETLARLIDETEEDAETEPVHGMLFALYQHAQLPEPGGSA
ncbi:ArsR/SmtB family transcription factor [Streptomyces fildesensis]|uniref:ArsR/SmtB family transcription factor n=1 Tax=Streptomyces fildesensis TaxID=375757 RepID=A0ABW8CJC4_9ACTN